MVSRLSITAKIWLSVGIFVLGDVVSTAVGQIQGLSTEATLRTAAEGLFPAAQKSQDAAFLFQQMVKGFSDAVMVQDTAALDRAGDEGRHVVSDLNAIASIRGLSEERAGDARKLASSVEVLVQDARGIYGTVLANPAAMTPEMQERMRGLATRTDTIKASLDKAKTQLAQDLNARLTDVAAQSAHQRWFALIVFLITLVVAGGLVNLTIRRAITGPILQVIDGVRDAAQKSAESSEQMASSGQLVARDAQEQAACIEETSASLEEISANTKQNAQQAMEADRMMQDGRKTVDKAAQAMNGLKASMDEISKASQQVSVVLKSIDEIAFHTNILALNAAVEAARAGEAGAGFSVVADEVRSLAHRAAQAAGESAEIIEKTIADINKSVGLVSVAHNAFQDVSAVIVSGSRVVSQIAASSEEQTRGIGHIGEAVTRMEKVTQNNAANAQRTAEAASSMKSQVETTRAHLEQLVTVVGVHSA